MKRRRRDVHKDFSRILIEDEDVIFSKDRDYHKQKQKEKKRRIRSLNGTNVKDRHFEEVENESIGMPELLFDIVSTSSY